MSTSTCFSSCVDLALQPDDLTIGDTCLLDQFLAFCNLYGTGRLFLTAPFFDDSFIEKVLEQSGPNVSISVIVRDERAAERMWNVLEEYRHRSLSVYVRPRLHAKVYIFECRNRVLAALIGSHNATKAGSKKNIEIGVFMSAANNKSEWAAIQRTRDYLYKHAKHYKDNGFIRKGELEHVYS
jgi:hypothetical protein